MGVGKMRRREARAGPATTLTSLATGRTALTIARRTALAAGRATLTTTGAALADLVARSLRLARLLLRTRRTGIQAQRRARLIARDVADFEVGLEQATDVAQQ